MGRHTIGYLVVDVFGLGALATFRLARRRCLHDVAFDTEVMFIGGSQDRVQRVKALDDRRKARLAEMRDQWGWAYHLLKWASGIVIAVVGLVVTVLKAVGVLSAAQASPPSTAAMASVPAATAPSTAATGVVVGTSAVLTVVAPVAAISAVAGSAEQRMTSSGLSQPQPSATYSGQGDGIVQIEKPAPISIARIEVTDNQGVIENIIVTGLSAEGVEAGSNLLVNEAGNYDGAVLLDPELAPRYPTVALGIEPAAGGSWTVEVADILDAPRLVDGSSGSGDEVFLYEGAGGTARIAHQGESNIWVEVYPTASMTNGVLDSYEFVPGVARRVVNEIGDFEGEFGLPPGPSVVFVHAGSFSVVDANGEWARPYGEWTISLD
jgi:hypothetical protein